MKIPKKKPFKHNPYARNNAKTISDNQLNKASELSLLIASHTYLSMGIKTHKGSVQDYRTIVNRLSTVINNHKGEFRHKSATIFHDIIVTFDDSIRVNVMLLGLELLARHSEVRGKSINIGLSRNMLDLQDEVYGLVSSDMLSTTSDYADALYDRLKEN